MPGMFRCPCSSAKCMIRTRMLKASRYWALAHTYNTPVTFLHQEVRKIFHGAKRLQLSGNPLTAKQYRAVGDKGSNEKMDFFPGEVFFQLIHLLTVTPYDNIVAFWALLDVLDTSLK